MKKIAIIMLAFIAVAITSKAQITKILVWKKGTTVAEEIPVVENIAAFNALEKGTKATLTLTEAEENIISLPVEGCTNPSVLAWRACRGHILKQFSTNWRYFVKVVPFRIWSPPYRSSLNRVCPMCFMWARIWCVRPVSKIHFTSVV